MELERASKLNQTGVGDWIEKVAETDRGANPPETGGPELRAPWQSVGPLSLSPDGTGGNCRASQLHAHHTRLRPCQAPAGTEDSHRHPSPLPSPPFPPSLAPTPHHLCVSLPALESPASSLLPKFSAWTVAHAPPCFTFILPPLCRCCQGTSNLAF